METKTKKSKLNISSLISFGGALIILSLASKLLHYSWADQFMVAAFVLEAFLFMLMGVQNWGNERTASTGGSVNDVQFNSEDTSLLSKEIKNALISLTHSSESNMMVSQAIISDVGLDNLIAKIEGLKKYNAINIEELQQVINDNVEKFKELGENVDSLNRVHLAQLNAYRTR